MTARIRIWFLSVTGGLWLTLVWGSGCVVGSEACKQDADCAPPFSYCAEGTCRQCALDTHCGANSYCLAGQCKLLAGDGGSSLEGTQPSEPSVNPDASGNPEPSGKTEGPSQEPQIGTEPVADERRVDAGAESVVREAPPEAVVPEAPHERPPTEAPPTERPPVEAPPRERPPVEAPPREAPPVEVRPEIPVDTGCRLGATRSCYTGKAGTAGVGLCREGRQSCLATGAWGTCSSQVLPQAEVCDGKDNNCDGTVDEQWPTKGQACEVGVGECKRSGTQTCVGGVIGCSVKPAATKAEDCDGKDNDCDGMVDENLQRTCYPSNTLGCAQGTDGRWQCQGTCSTGSQSCTGAAWSTCINANMPATRDVCLDSKDNNCDGTVDENCCVPTRVLYSKMLSFGSLFDLAYAPTKDVGAVAISSNLREYSTTSGNGVQGFTNGHNSGATIYSVAYHPGGTLLASGGSDGNVVVWRSSGALVVRLTPSSSDSVYAVAFSPDGKWLVAGAGNNVYRWDTTSTTTGYKRLTGHQGSVFALAFDAQSKLLASGAADGTVRLWDIVAGSWVRTLNGHTADINSVSFHPDGKALASAGDDSTVRFWEVGTGRLLRTNSYGSQVSQVAYSPSGSWVAFGLDNGSVRILEVSTYQVAHSRRVSGLTNRRINGLAWSRDSRTLLVGAAGGQLESWRCP